MLENTYRRRQAVQYVSELETFVPWLTFLTRQLKRGRDNHCGNEVGKCQQDIEI